MKTRKRFVIASTLCVAVFVGMTVSTLEASSRSGQVAAGDQARETLKEIQRSASKAADEADLLWRQGDELSQDAHYDGLMAVREEINRMGREVTMLQSESGLTPWERQAIGAVEPLLADTAKDAQSAINYFNENKADLWDRDYHSYLGGIDQGSERIAATLRDYLKYAKARDREQQLEESLKVTGELHDRRTEGRKRR